MCDMSASCITAYKPHMIPSISGINEFSYKDIVLNQCIRVIGFKEKFVWRNHWIDGISVCSSRWSVNKYWQYTDFHELRNIFNINNFYIDFSTFDIDV